MKSLELLNEIANKNNGLILTKTAVESGITRANLSRLCKIGKLTRIASGQYILPENLNDEMLSLQMRSKLIIF